MLKYLILITIYEVSTLHLKNNILYLIITIFITSLIFISGCSYLQDEKISESHTTPTTNIKTFDEPNFPQGFDHTKNLDSPSDVPDEIKVIWEAWKYIQDDYVDQESLDPKIMAEEAIKAMIASIGDPQTTYIKPEVLAGSFGDMYKGNFEGIGAHVTINSAGKIVIVAPIEGGPAKAAGIKSGDIILSVDGKSIEGLSLLEVVALIRGPKGSTVTIEVKHLAMQKNETIEIIRDVIVLPTVLLRSSEDDPYAHIRITNFYPNTNDQLKNILKNLEKRNYQGIILDLRGNPGGTLKAAIEVTSQFLEDGIVMYSIDGKGKRTDYKVLPEGLATKKPMVVLINRGSASSSEVLAGAIQDTNRGLIIGSRSYGKGGINILRQLSNKGGLYITIKYWFTPNGTRIHETGIQPDIIVTDSDPKIADINQLNKAKEELKKIITNKSEA